MTKRIFGMSLCMVLGLAMVLMLTPNHVEATPFIKKAFDANYVKTSTNTAFKEAAGKAKCNICHYGKAKKNRNDFGKAISKNLKAAGLTKKEKDPGKLGGVLKKAVAEKNADKVTFESLIKAGKLPGKAPATP